MAGRSAERIVVGLSGGVDSSVAALRLVRAGFDVHALFMSNWDDDDAYCTSAQDFQDARAVARELNIPLHRVSFAAEYKERVFAYFLAEHHAGRTPNPDVLCNREIKFGTCLAHAQRLGAQRFATGHYARLEHGGAGGAELHKARDENKDQSYFLHAVQPHVFESVLFPLGDLHKAEVRELARSAGLPVYDKPDSTGICFIGERPFREFLAQYIPTEPGPIETVAGERIGTHRGLAFYTLGQRGGLEVGGRRGHDEGAWYVADRVRPRNALVAVQQSDHPRLMSRRLSTEAMHWLSAPSPGPLMVGIKVRHRQPDQPGQVDRRTDGGVDVTFDSSQRAVAPGQFAVLYTGTRCLGGAVIASTVSDENPPSGAEIPSKNTSVGRRNDGAATPQPI